MSQFECKLSDLEEPKKEIKSVPINQEKKVHFDEKKPEPVNDLQVQVEKKQVDDIISNISNNKNTIFVIVISYILLNTTTVKEFVFKILPQLMDSSSEYNLMGTLLCALLLGTLTILYISYF
tara:strand:+ start:23392 stop:23757 length:366 start_codon:yes stop_codon:yes gene_type:complete